MMKSFLIFIVLMELIKHLSNNLQTSNILNNDYHSQIESFICLIQEYIQYSNLRIIFSTSNTWFKLEIISLLLYFAIYSNKPSIFSAITLKCFRSNKIFKVQNYQQNKTNKFLMDAQIIIYNKIRLLNEQTYFKETNFRLKVCR